MLIRQRPSHPHLGHRHSHSQPTPLALAQASGVFFANTVYLSDPIYLLDPFPILTPPLTSETQHSKVVPSLLGHCFHPLYVFIFHEPSLNDDTRTPSPL